MPSELKVNKLSPYTGTTLTLGDSGDTVSTDAVVQASQFVGGGLNAYRNIIINGDMQIAQRGTSVSVSDGSNEGYQTLDRWRTGIGGMSAVTTISQSTDVPSGQGFANSFKIDVTTADASLSGSDFWFLQQRFEGQNLQMLKKGTSNAEKLTLSFWIKATKTGTNNMELEDKDNSRFTTKQFTINSANTWEKKVLTFDADTTGAFDNDNGDSLDLNIWIGAGSNWTTGSPTTWASEVAANRAPSQTNHFDSTANEWYITGVQLEAGTTASDFEFLPYDVNLLRCQRYYQTISKMSGYTGSGTTTLQCSLAFPITMRATPSFSQSGVFRFDDAATAFTQSSTGLSATSTDNTGSILNIQNFSFNGTYRPHGKANTAKLEIDAEL